MTNSPAVASTRVRSGTARRSRSRLGNPAPTPSAPATGRSAPSPIPTAIPGSSRRSPRGSPAESEPASASTADLSPSAGRVAHQLWDHTGGPRSRGLAVRVVVVPPRVRRGLRIALRRILPLLLTAERRDIQVAPSASHRLVAPEVDEVGPVDPLAVADEGVGPVPLVHAEVFVKVVGDRVPRDQLPAHALLQAPDLGLGSARNEGECRVPRVQVGGVRDLVGEE